MKAVDGRSEYLSPTMFSNMQSETIQGHKISSLVLNRVAK